MSYALIEHPRSLVHVTLLDLDKQGESSRPLPVGIAVWRDKLDVISSDNMERRLLLHKKYTTQSFKYAFIIFLESHRILCIII